MKLPLRRWLTTCVLIISFFAAASFQLTHAALNYSEDVIIAPGDFPDTIESNRFTNVTFTVENKLNVDFTNHFLTFKSDKLILTYVAVSFNDGRQHQGEFYSETGKESRVFFTQRTDTNSFANLPFPPNARANYLITLKTDPGQNNSIHLNDILSFYLAFYGTTAAGVQYTSEVPLQHQMKVNKLNSILQPTIAPTGSVTPTPSLNAPTPLPTEVTTNLSPTPTPVSNDSMIITIPPEGGNTGGSGGSGGSPVPTPNLSQEELKDVGGLVLEVPGGNKIEFTQPVDLGNLESINDLKDLVILSEKGKVSVNLDKASGLNRSAKITMTNIFFDGDFTILKDGKNASRYISDVTYDKEKGILTFTVKEMGDYEVVAGAGREITATTQTNSTLRILILAAVGMVLLTGFVFGRKYLPNKRNTNVAPEEPEDTYQSSVV